MSNFTEVKVAVDGCRASLTFTNESGLNVSSRETLARLAHGVETLARNPAVRLTVVRAEGKVFLAGADIKEMSGFDADRARELSVFGNRTMDTLESMPSIAVAAIQGAALGGGCEIALACDFRIAVAKAKIGLPETTLGLIPGWGGTKRASRLLGPSRARRLIFGGEVLSAQDALQIGLIDEVVSDIADLGPAIERLFESMHRGGPRAIAMVKRALATGDEPAAFAECFAGSESGEGIAAFMEKRPATWMETTQ
ncbi:MAG: enoyl-CoA hydratase/isomerase family protein [Planctomycetes bacterium]|nr:enoyl-CoA hydratase/isomerase family protein [Planctomycetota bacterium]